AAEVVRAPALEEYARENAKLAEEATRVDEQLASATEVLQSTAALRMQLSQAYANSQRTVETAGLTTESGKLLRQKQDELPNVRELRRRKDARAREESRATFRSYELNDQRSTLSDLDQAVDALTSAAETEVDVEEARQLIEKRRAYLDNLIELYGSYSRELSKLEAEEAQLITTSEEYADFIAQRVLWIRSCDAPQWEHLPALIAAAGWLVDPGNWRQLGRSLAANITDRPLPWGMLALGLGVLALGQRTARRRLREIGEVAAKRTCIEILPTLEALWLTIVISVPWPYLMYGAGWLLDATTEESEFVRAWANAARIAATCLFLFEFLRQVCRKKGLADAHFDWPDASLAQLRRQSRWLNALALPLVAVVAVLEAQSDRRDFGALWSPSLGRVAFIVLMGLSTFFFFRLLLAKTSPFRQWVERTSSSGSFYYLKNLWRPFTVVLPVVLGGLAISGYYYSAQQASLSILNAIFLLTCVAVLGGVVRRWLLVNQRAIAREQARQRRAQLAAAQAAATAQEGEVAPTIPPETVEETVDLAALGEQTLKLVRWFLCAVAIVGLLAIFKRLLPALAFVGSYPVWPGVIPLQWGQVLLSLAAILMTYVAARDLPALVELTLLKLLPFDSGARYALTSLSRYLLVALGVGLACKAVGIDWDDVQWLVAAMGVGLGFGLQEIFANFVSGIILLFERPIRVGDVVTLGDKTGVVNRIRIRATTIVDWDRKEYVIPNKDLVTGSLLNWTLTDHTNRVVIEVGIAYGSDTDQACALLKKIACEHPQVLSDPEPVATFQGFGDSCLNLTLRCYLPTLEFRLATIHELHTHIHRRFNEAGIEIPFPQRDLNFRNAPPSWPAPQ
ncbi:MAG: mechanosensitive ion channel, partial [Planctomycetales bacterium]|nr:mechanosensitive ion channel [Planctomycetales bacterium]